jgi:hypothetical protein
MTDERKYEIIRRPLSADEVNELGLSLAREIQRRIDLEAQRKTTAAAIAAEIKDVEKEIAGLARKMSNGYEEDEAEVLVVLDEPVKGMKRIVLAADPTHIVREEAMTYAERQDRLDFER